MDEQAEPEGDRVSDAAARRDARRAARTARWQARDQARYDAADHRPFTPRWGYTMAALMVLVAVGFVAISFGAALIWPEGRQARNFGGTVIVGVLLVMAAVLVVIRSAVMQARNRIRRSRPTAKPGDGQ